MKLMSKEYEKLYHCINQLFHIRDVKEKVSQKAEPSPFLKDTLHVSFSNDVKCFYFVDVISY